MNINGVAKLKIRPCKVNGKANRSGKFILTEVIISDALMSECFLS